MRRLMLMAMLAGCDSGPRPVSTSAPASPGVGNAAPDRCVCEPADSPFASPHEKVVFKVRMGLERRQQQASAMNDCQVRESLDGRFGLLGGVRQDQLILSYWIVSFVPEGSEWLRHMEAVEDNLRVEADAYIARGASCK